MSALSLHIIGAAGSGKSTVFDALTLTPEGPSFVHKSGTRIGSSRVPDERLVILRDMYNPKKFVPAEITFVDADAGLAKGASAFMADADAYVLVLQAFGDMDYEGNPVNPSAQLDSFLLECIVADMEKIERRRKKSEQGKHIGQAMTDGESKLLDKAEALLEDNKPLSDLEMNFEEEKLISGFQFLSGKPILVVANVSEDQLEGADLGNVPSACEDRGIQLMTLSATLEAEIAQLPADEQSEFLKDYGLEAPARNRLIQVAYQMMDFIGFFTVGEDEVRAWTIKRGTNAQGAAGKIHSDIERGFIRAEVVTYEHLIEAGSMSKCKENGTFRLEGKEYIVNDGEIVHYRFSV